MLLPDPPRLASPTRCYLCCAVRGTEQPHAAAVPTVVFSYALSYAVSCAILLYAATLYQAVPGTKLPYAAALSTVVIRSMLIRCLRYCTTVCCCSAYTTELLHPMRPHTSANFTAPLHPDLRTSAALQVQNQSDFSYKVYGACAVFAFIPPSPPAPSERS
eukprot:1358062-Rhodomonas_salina.2